MKIMTSTACAAALALFIFVSLSSSWPGIVHAQTVYKCRLDDKITYSDMPCPSGVPMPATAPASPEAQERRRHEQGRQEREADRLAAARHQDEARAQRLQQQAAKRALIAREKCANAQLKKKWADDDLSATLAGASSKSTARHGSAQQARLKAQRAAEKMALACPT